MDQSMQIFNKATLCLALIIPVLVVSSCYEGRVDPPVTPKDTNTIEKPPEVDPDTDPKPNPDGDGGPSPDEPAVEDPCATLDFTYENAVQPLSSARCDRCHGAGGSFPNLLSKSGWSENIDSTISRIKGQGPLMPKGGPKLPEDQLAGVENWATCKFP